jgi:transcription elongation GreA/GreB family factor
MSTISYYTAGLKKIKRIGLFKNVMRPKASADIGEARDKGDLSENAGMMPQRSTRNARNENCEVGRCILMPD